MWDTRHDPSWSRVELGEVILRRVLISDAGGVFAVHGDPRVYRFDPDETHLDVEQSIEFLGPMLEHWLQHGFGYWAVLVPGSWWPKGVPSSQSDDAGRVFAGLGGVQHYLLAEQAVLNVYFRLSPQVQGRGLAGLVVGEAQRLARALTPRAELIVRTRPVNAAAMRVATRAGFVDEGLQPGTTDMQLLRWSSDLERP